MIEWQADDVVPEQAMRYVGAVRTYGARMNFFLSVPNTLMIAALFYVDSSTLQSLFPSMAHWIGFLLFVVVPGAIVLDRALLHPAQIIYQQHQHGRENRSPNYRETMENQRKLEALHDRLDELEGER